MTATTGVDISSPAVTLRSGTRSSLTAGTLRTVPSFNRGHRSPIGGTFDPSALRQARCPCSPPVEEDENGLLDSVDQAVIEQVGEHVPHVRVDHPGAGEHPVEVVQHSGGVVAQLIR